MSVVQDSASAPAESASRSAEPLLRVRDLEVSYPVPGGVFRRAGSVAVVRGVSFDIAAGETLGLVGESGSGKSTTGRAILRLLDASSGSIRFDGSEVTAFGRRTPLTYRRDVQAVFQDPNQSLNPRHPVSAALTNALKRQGMSDRRERERVASEAFEQVGLQRAHLNRYPFELSGGQQQRVAIARALVLRPRLVVCDEAVSALDLSTQGQIMNLLVNLQEETGVSYLFIAHDLAIVRHISDRIAVMRKGEIVEQASSHELFASPQDPYTRKLLGASPSDRPEGREERRAVRRRFRQSRGEA